ncbi:MAG: transposase [bacterium]|nr:transposase [bacterium]
MIILQEFHGWSDAQLFEACNFSLIVRRALGCEFDESIPVAST